MTYAGTALQTGIYTRLSSVLNEDVYSSWVDEDATFPYAVIDGMQTEPGDTKTTNGEESTFEIHAFDKDVSSRATINSMMTAIHGALHDQESNITVSGYTVTFCQSEYSTVLLDTATDAGDDHYYHGVMRFRIRIVKT